MLWDCDLARTYLDDSILCGEVRYLAFAEACLSLSRVMSSRAGLGQLIVRRWSFYPTNRIRLARYCTEGRSYKSCRFRTTIPVTLPRISTLRRQTSRDMDQSKVSDFIFNCFNKWTYILSFFSAYPQNTYFNSHHLNNYQWCGLFISRAIFRQSHSTHGKHWRKFRLRYIRTTRLYSLPPPFPPSLSALPLLHHPFTKTWWIIHSP